jgi:hypothetical protein
MGLLRRLRRSGRHLVGCDCHVYTKMWCYMVWTRAHDTQSFTNSTYLVPLLGMAHTMDCQMSPDFLRPHWSFLLVRIGTDSASTGTWMRSHKMEDC